MPVEPRSRQAEASAVEASQPDTPPPDHDVVAAPRRRRRRRRRWPFALPLIVLLALAAGVGAWGYNAYRSFADAIERSNARLDPRAETLLAPDANELEKPQLTLVFATGGDARGAATFILVRTDPDDRRVGTFVLAPGVPAEPGPAARNLDEAVTRDGAGGALAAVRQLLGRPVDHVLVIDLDRMRELIDLVGGVTLVNPRDAIAKPPYQGRFPKGRLRLDGEAAMAYASSTTGGFSTAADNQERLARALVHAVVTPSHVTELPRIARELAQATTTDMTPMELASLGYLHGRAKNSVECRAKTRVAAGRVREFAAARAIPAHCTLEPVSYVTLPSPTQVRWFVIALAATMLLLLAGVVLQTWPGLVPGRPSLRLPRPSLRVPRRSMRAPRPSVRLPRPSVHVPRPSVRLPRPSVHVPRPSVRAPRLSVRLPRASVRLPRPSLRVRRPSFTFRRPPAAAATDDRPLAVVRPISQPPRLWRAVTAPIRAVGHLWSRRRPPVTGPGARVGNYGYGYGPPRRRDRWLGAVSDAFAGAADRLGDHRRARAYKPRLRDRVWDAVDAVSARRAFRTARRDDGYLAPQPPRVDRWVDALEGVSERWAAAGVGPARLAVAAIAAVGVLAAALAVLAVA
jgi:polyisoprenyl-teichoic acid--peptidoglycan teichoic acid transferase